MQSQTGESLSLFKASEEEKRDLEKKLMTKYNAEQQQANLKSPDGKGLLQRLLRTTLLKESKEKKVGSEGEEKKKNEDKNRKKENQEIVLSAFISEIKKISSD
ncbi:hypothetical protein TNIN_331481 [Trichonephila inaurata madagascariensis]|uniref:Uncharacterized protein n=1 Tax=Trichonephila inaurata madagascariensis TaxID=2747483 RepID=A0A8X7BZ56_9ARAC|nr:hypothetical protein TNIN_331481 [Trichonephila inaurata madagascariensis]